MKKITSALFAILFVSLAAFLSSCNQKPEQPFTYEELNHRLDSVTAVLQIFQDSVENVLNRGTRCDSFATSPDGKQKIAIRNMTSYREYMQNRSSADSVLYAIYRSPAFKALSEKHSVESEKRYVKQNHLTKKGLTTNSGPGITKLAFQLLAETVTENHTEETDEAIETLREQSWVQEILSYTNPEEEYYSDEMFKISMPAFEKNIAQNKAYWEKFLKNNH